MIIIIIYNDFFNESNFHISSWLLLMELKLGNTFPRYRKNEVKMKKTDKPDEQKNLIEHDLSRIIEMAWEDRTPFEAILSNYNLDESALMKIMRANLKFSSYKLWRKRVKTKSIKHLSLRSKEVTRAYCPTQYKIGR